MIPLPRHIRRVILELAFWLLLEFLGNASGLDALADFGEFVFSKETHFPVPELALILTEMIKAMVGKSCVALPLIFLR